MAAGTQETIQVEAIVQVEPGAGGEVLETSQGTDRTRLRLWGHADGLPAHPTVWANPAEEEESPVLAPGGTGQAHHDSTSTLRPATMSERETLG
jgi:hypothetical protein